MQDCRIIQLKIPKTASSSIENALLKMHRKKIIQKMRSFGHGKPFKEEYNGVVFLASVRNPYDRLLSAYRYIIENKKDKPEHKYIFEFGSFQAFTLNIAKFAYKNRFFYPQCNWMFTQGKKNYDFLIRYENLQEDWDKFTAKYTSEKFNLPKIRPSKHKPWQDVYTDAMKKAVQIYYKQDFIKLNYPIS